jgi:hemolysin activation/secretion protein
VLGAVAISSAMALPCAAQPSSAESELINADELRRQQAREQEQRLRLQRTPDVRLERPAGAPAPALPRDETPCFRIETIALQGPDPDAASRLATGLPVGWSVWLTEAIETHDLPTERGIFSARRRETDSPLYQRSGLCLGSQGVAIVQQRAQAALLARGYVTSRVLVEPQNLASGRLHLTVIPGRIHAIRLEHATIIGEAPAEAGTSARPAEAMLAITSPAQVGDVLNLRDVEQTLENLKRVPTADADIRIEPAATPATSDIVIRRQQGFPLRGTMTLDDSGSPGTGIYQGSATVSWDAPLGLSDLLYLTFNNDLGGGDPGSRGTYGRTAHYSVPWGYWSAGFTQSGNRYYQSVAGQNQTYVYSGTSEISELKLGRVLARDATSKTSASLKAFQRRSNNYIDDTEVQIQRRVVGGWELGLAHKAALGTAGLDASMAYRVGTNDFGAVPAPEEASGTGTSRFVLTLAELSLRLPLSWQRADQAPPLRGYYSGLLRLQNNLTPLTPQDRFAIGGRYTVRGFDGYNVLSAERGGLLRNELAIALPNTWLEGFTGLDLGVVDGPSSDTLAGKQLAGAVVGLRGTWKRLSFEIFAGGPLDKPQGFRTAYTTAGFSLILGF